MTHLVVILACLANTQLNASSNSLVVVEFDTFENDWDTSPDHIESDINSFESVATRTRKTSIKDGQIVNAWFSYKASTKNLSAFLNYKEKPIFKGSSSLSYIVDVAPSGGIPR